jgi:glycyl-tRNA synthetase beta chain
MSDAHKARTLLLELHCEEIPARFLVPLAAEFLEAFAAFAAEQRLGHAAAEAMYSPRKLAWRIEGLPDAQPDQTETQVGPPKRVCLDEAGALTVQGRKFMEKWGADPKDIRFGQPQGKKEPCAVLEIPRPGRATADILSEALPRLISGLHVPKAMRWGDSAFEFVRPIRSILCIFGARTIPFTVDGVASGNTTWGHRLHHRSHKGPIAVASPEKYEEALKGGGVMARFGDRRRAIAEQLEARAAEVGGRPVADEGLLDTLALIAEWPTVLRGAFPADFMDLPREVLVTSLKEHQKAFCVESPGGGDLLPHFLSIANRPDDPDGHVVAGNEWVLKARLYDARFFFAEDRRSPLASLAPKLKNLTFHRDLGDYLEKSERISRIAAGLAERLGLDPDLARAAAGLCKADLVTLMVGEFPELQGTMGGHYLRLEGAPEPIWRAVGEHYMPLGVDASLPASPYGAALAIADKLDTLAGCFSIGMAPSGSKDPLALRRAGMGIVRIIWEKGLPLPLDALIDLGLEAAARPMGQVRGDARPMDQVRRDARPMDQVRRDARPMGKAEAPPEETRRALLEFFEARAAHQLEVAGVPVPIRHSAIVPGWADLADLKARCAALSAFLDDPRFASLAMGAKRISNILRDEDPADAFDARALEQAEEKELARRLESIESAESAAGYEGLLPLLAALARPLEDFFGAVMVKCDDPRLRAARLSLLHRLRRGFMRVADFGKWQG